MVAQRVPLLVLCGLLGVDFALTLNHLALHQILGRVPDLFHLDREANIPTWWSSAQLLVAGLLLALVILRNFRADRRSWSLILLSATLVLFSVDETACFHERIGTFIDAHLGGKIHSQMFRTGYWPLVIGFPAIGLIGYWIWLAAAFLAEVRGASVRFTCAFAVLLFGAVGVEALSNVRASAVEFFISTLEETLEMAGGSLLIWSALDLLRRHPSMAEVWGGLRPLPADPRRAAVERPARGVSLPPAPAIPPRSGLGFRARRPS